MKELRCPACESRVRPDTRRSGVLPRSMKFNQIVGCDLFEFDEFGYKVFILNMICWGTGYQQACRVPDKTSASVAHWHEHYRMPELLITHQGPEFVGKNSLPTLQITPVFIILSIPKSPWQQGRTERAGGSLKEDLCKIVQECSLVTEDDFDIALAEAVSVRNTHPARSGFSAQQ